MPATSTVKRIALAAVASTVVAAAAPTFAWVQMTLALGLIVLAVAKPDRRLVLLDVGAALLWGSLFAFAFFFLTDQFTLRSVWLYSSPELPAQLKLANVWSGDEGITLMLATFCATLAARSARLHPARAVAATALIAAWYGATALWLNPFAATPADWLAQAPAQGMHAHLMKIWMLFHAPLLLAAYAWILALVGPALAALAGETERWPARAHAHARRAWTLLTAGIGFGMIWAFEDAMYGQIWHWDPVQTAIFAVWCFLGAHLHGIPAWRRGTASWRWMPLAAVLAAVLTAAAMAVTRNPLLASSHRYVDAATWISHLALAALLLASAAHHGWASRSQRQNLSAARTSGSARWGLRLTQVGFFIAGIVAIAQLLYAFGAASMEAARPDKYKPFLGLLANMTQGAELASLRAAFEQWDVDGYVLAQHLLWPLAALGLIGGWYFFRRVSRRAAWGSLALALLACAGAYLQRGGLSGEYAGAGILSQSIVALLPMLDVVLVAGAYLALACATWAARVAVRNGWRAAAATVPIAALHIGVILMLWGGLLSTALNSYSQHEIELGAAGSAWELDRQGYRFRLRAIELEDSRDGGPASAASIRALTTIEVATRTGEILDGQTLYRDARPALERYRGPLRQVCELLDYRYARHVSTKGYLLQPLIDHRWSASAQFWVAPAAIIEAVEGAREHAKAIVVIKVFPFSSLLWTGLVLTVISALWLAFQPQNAANRTETERTREKSSAATMRDDSTF